jgi:hypothetical protein
MALIQRCSEQLLKLSQGIAKSSYQAKMMRTTDIKDDDEMDVRAHTDFYDHIARL